MGKIITKGIIVLALLFLIGCKGEKKEPKGPVADYYNGMMRALDRAEDAQKQANLNILKAAIAHYRVENGKNPSTLEDLRGQLGENFSFGDFLYSPETGEVALKSD
jgi:hypothetical protein